MKYRIRGKYRKTARDELDKLPSETPSQLKLIAVCAYYKMARISRQIYDQSAGNISKITVFENDCYYYVILVCIITHPSKGNITAVRIFP